MIRSPLQFHCSATPKVIDQENLTMNKWVLIAILLGIAAFSYVSIIVKMS